MFLYVRNIKNQEEAQFAIDKGAAALAVALSPARNLESEAFRTWLEELPLQIMKIGEFGRESYYDIEEMVTFCHLDILLLRDLHTVKDFCHYTGRVMVEITDWELQDLKRFDEAAYQTFLTAADGIFLRLADYTNLDNKGFWQYLRELEKPIFLAGDFLGGEISEIMALFAEKKVPNIAGIFLDYEDLL